jgi:dipeptidyl aminopeptidase/acylaminoacyl peptidase
MIETSPMERNVSFRSDGPKLSAVLRIPHGMREGERRPAFVVLHGFGSTKNAGNVIRPTEMLSALGYVTFRFDMRGCGESEGEKGRVICLEQVEDTRSAVSWLCEQPEVDPERVGLLGSSFGAAVAVYTAGVDSRPACVISSGGWGNGERKFRGQHKTTELYEQFLAMLEAGRKHKEATGQSLQVSRYAIVPIPEHLRKHVVPGSIQTFPVDTAQSMFDFRADDVVGKISPRPIIFLHSSEDSVTPTEQSIAMFDRAGLPKDLHLFSETDHFMFDESNLRVRTVVADWLSRFFPVRIAEH